ncbi:hypothetical protein G647_06048 [Cladophialophora carrionii CBS 160.54]|uniref:HMG box domain-containing protein n=1 Tax=Cladophialophora carrionii CBS 160.54 TaxID=1279043 RepID=V9D6R9_9EURO|nr:uncharacterized protein G647_06048 [Cladophialophora carrionii CBS 160.54]ETI21978.1 hypothetical protein G647_06048 [Cladophialophora carrionii CBS 160.54]
MTVAMPFSRSLAKQLLARSARLLTRPVSSNPLLRVDGNYATGNDQSSHAYKLSNLRASLKLARTYATASAKPAGRPKQHTGRTPTKRTPKSTKGANAGEKPAAKKSKKKAAQKTKPKAAKKKPSKSALLKKARTDHADLKAAALLEEPKQLPSNPYQIILVQETKGSKGNVTNSAAAASNKYKNLALEERERYNHEANQNKSKNEEAYKRWVQSHSALEIRNANNARRLLNRKAKAAGKKKHIKPIHDDRTVHQPRNAYSFFFKERNDSGDLNGMSVAERGKLAGQEWKSLSAAEKKPYEDQAAADKTRYLEEYKTVYGDDPPSVKRQTK